MILNEDMRKAGFIVASIAKRKKEKEPEIVDESQYYEALANEARNNNTLHKRGRE